VKKKKKKRWEQSDKLVTEKEKMNKNEWHEGKKSEFKQKPQLSKRTRWRSNDIKN
jgi:hypothetical protein